MKIKTWLRKAFRAIAAPIVHEWVLFVVLTLLWNPQLFLYDVNSLVFELNPLFSFYSFCFSAVGAYIQTVLVYWIGKRWLKVTCYVVAALVFSSTVFLYENFNSMLTSQILVALLETNPSETSDFLYAFGMSGGMAKGLLTLFIVSSSILLLECFVKPALDKWRCVWLRRTLVALALVMVFTGIVLGVLKTVGVYGSDSLQSFYNREERYGSGDQYSRVFISASGLYFASVEVDEILDATRAVFNQDVTTSERGVTVVVVVGESYNKHHASIYGYNLPTTPRMEAERDSGNLFVFTDVISPYNTTSITLKNVFTTGTISSGEPWYETPLFPAVFKRAGYEVWFWDNQRAYATLNNFSFSLNAVLFNADVQRLCYDHLNSRSFKLDGELVNDLSQKIGKPSDGANRLVIMHLMGQHTHYAKRYPENFARFSKNDIKRNEAYFTDNMRWWVSIYDNATLYNDYVLDTVFRMFADDNAVVVYFSDHGEEVFDYRDFRMRDHTPDKTPDMVRHENEVPFVVWCSPEFQRLHPDLVSRLKACAERPFMIDAVSQMLFTLGAIQSPYYSPSQDVLSDDYSPGKRIIYDHIDYDELMRR